MHKTILTILAGLFLITACQEQKAPGDNTTAGIVDTTVKARIDSTLKSLVDSNKTVMASALIFENGKEVYYNAFGYADREAQKPMDRNTLVRIYSMTKPVTGVALMTLYEKGLFQLDDSLAK